MSKIAISNEMMISNNFVFLVYKMNPVTAPLLYEKESIFTICAEIIRNEKNLIFLYYSYPESYNIL